MKDGITSAPHSGEISDFPRPHVRRSMMFLSSGAVLGLLVAGYGLFTAKGTRSHAVPPEDIALVNNRPILRSDFMTQVQTQFTESFEQSTAGQRAKVLTDMLAEELQVQRGLEIDLPSFDPDVRAAMVAGVELEVSADILAQQPDEQRLRSYFEAHKARYVSEGMLRMRDLLIRPSADSTTVTALGVAQQAVSALRAGAPLGQVLQRYHLSDSGKLMDQGHVDNDDIFEFAAKAKLEPDVYVAASRLQSGQVSDAIESQDGTHIVVMLVHRLPIQLDYEAAADKVWTDYKNDAQARVREANIGYLRGRADILLSDDARGFGALGK